MKSGKKVVITLIIAILVLLLIAGGVLAYAYLATDIFKTDKQLFFKYFSQISAEEGSEHSFFDNRINDLYEKKMQTPYENSGKITVEAEYPEDLMIEDSIISKVNELAIRFSGNVDIVNKKAEQNIEIDYGNDVILPINYRQDGDKFGLQIDELSKKFIAIRNENLDTLVGNFTEVEKLNEVVSNIDYEKFKFTQEELNQLKAIYEPILNEILADENFSRTNTEQNESYILELKSEQIKNIIVKILEATKQNTLIIDKINEMILEYDAEAEKIDVTIIDDVLESVNELDISEIPNLKITLVQSNKQLKKIIIESGDVELSIEKNVAEEDLIYDINCDVEAEETADIPEVNVHYKLQYSGLNNLTDVSENYELGFSITAEEQTMANDYKIEANTKFVENATIEALDENVAVFLNDYDETQVTNFLTQVGTKLIQINKAQMEKLGLKEYENPLLYSNPITSLLIYGFSTEPVVDSTNSENESIDNIEESDGESNIVTQENE